MPTSFDDISPTPPGPAERKRRKPTAELRRLFAEAVAAGKVIVVKDAKASQSDGKAK